MPRWLATSWRQRPCPSAKLNIGALQRYAIKSVALAHRSGVSVEATAAVACSSTR